MQHLYIRRKFSGWGLRLGLSEGLLLSSAGLAIALLLYAAATSSAAADMKWQASNSFTTTRLATKIKDNATAPLASLAGEPRHYWMATTVAYRGLAAAAPSPNIGEPQASFDQAAPAPASAVKAAMQHSWTIIKLAFR